MNIQNIQNILAILELPANSFIFDSNLPFEEATNKLENFKKLVLKQRKKLALKYHPDINNGEEERMKTVNKIVDIVNQLHIKRRPQNYFRVVINPYIFSQTNTSTTTSASFFTATGY